MDNFYEMEIKFYKVGPTRLKRVLDYLESNFKKEFRYVTIEVSEIEDQQCIKVYAKLNPNEYKQTPRELFREFRKFTVTWVESFLRKKYISDIYISHKLGLNGSVFETKNAVKPKDIVVLKNKYNLSPNSLNEMKIIDFERLKESPFKYNEIKDFYYIKKLFGTELDIIQKKDAGYTINFFKDGHISVNFFNCGGVNLVEFEKFPERVEGIVFKATFEMFQDYLKICDWLLDSGIVEFK